MKKTFDNYSKPDAHIALNDLPPEVSVPSATSSQRLVLPNVAVGYTKKDGVLSPALFIIVSGGEKRERDYFMRISNMKTFPRINIKFVSNSHDTQEGGLSPDKMYEEALKLKDDYDKGKQADIEDRMFLLSDVDHFVVELLRVKPLCEMNGMKLIVSNPCFELWLYYGKCSERPLDFDIPENKLKISSYFKTYLGNKITGGVNPTTAIFDIDTAIYNAGMNYEMDENGIPVLFSTNMFMLAKELKPLIDSELTGMKKANEERLLRYRGK